MPKVTKEDLVLNDKVKFDNKGGAILGVLEGPVADFMHSTRNGRIYSEDLWEKVFKNPIVQEQFENGGVVGELDHPADRDDICSEKVAVIMPEPPVKKNGEYYGKFNILDTPCGRIVYTLAKAGFKLGVSSRGTGDVDEYTDEVDPDTYDFTCFDVVLLPAVKSARMSLVTEGLDKKANYKKLLKESIEKSSEKDQEIMKETLNNLNIKLDEEVKKNTCVLCGKEFEGWGNNPEPLASEGVCCDECNQTKVIPARLEQVQNAKLNEEAGDIFEPVEGDLILNGEEVSVPAEAVNTEPDPAADVLTAETETEETSCEECDEQIKDLLHKFLDKYDIEFEEEDNVEDIENSFIELFKETIKPETCEECKPEEEVADIETIAVEPETETEAEDAGSLEILEQLQNTLKENKILKEQVKNLQDLKAVSDTKVGKLTEDLTTFKAIATNAGRKALSIKSLESENVNLAKEVSSLKEELAKKAELLSDDTATISKLQESNKLLQEKLSVTKDDSVEVRKLQESINTIRDESNKRLAESQKSNNQLKSLVEKYKTLAHQIADRYIESKALNLGVTVNEIKNRLNESYSIDDVDAVCEELETYSLNISQLPFAFDKPGNARMRIREDKSKDPLKSIDSEYDDTVDDFLLDLAGLKK